MVEVFPILTKAPTETVDFSTADGVFIKSIVVPKRDTALPQHSHAYDHTSFIATGVVGLWKDREFDAVYRAPAAILIKAGVKHTFLTLEANTTILCIHNLNGAAAVEVLEEHELTAEDVAALREPV